MNYNLECWVILVLCTNKVKNPIVEGMQGTIFRVLVRLLDFHLSLYVDSHFWVFNAELAGRED